MKKKLLTLLAAFALFTPNFVLATGIGGEVNGLTPVENKVQQEVKKEEKVPICHVTGSETNRYVFLKVAKSAVDGEGKNDHTKHQKDGFKDLIPAKDWNKDEKIDQKDCDEKGGGGQEECLIKNKIPQLLTPTNNATNVPINTTLTWKAMAGADYYVVILNGKEYTTKKNSLKVNLEYGKSYKWKVQAVDKDFEKCVSCWSPTWCFKTKEKPVEKPKVPICHVTGSATNRYVLIRVNEKAVPAHQKHEKDGFKDIIPATDVNKDGKITVDDCYPIGGGEEEPPGGGQGGGTVVSPIVTTTVVEAAPVEGFGGGVLPEAGNEAWIISLLGAAMGTFLLRLKAAKKAL